MLNGAAELVSVAALLAVLAWAVIRPRGWPEAVAAVLVLAQMCDGEGDLLIVARDGDRSRPGPARRAWARPPGSWSITRPAR